MGTGKFSPLGTQVAAVAWPTTSGGSHTGTSAADLDVESSAAA